MSNKNKVLLIGEKQIKETSLIQLNVDTKTIVRTVFDTQNIYLRPVLGDSLFNILLDAVAALPGTPMPVNLKALLEEYVQPYLSHAVVQDLIINLTYKITSKGLLKYNDTQAVALTADEIEYAKNYYENRTQSYKAALIHEARTVDFGQTQPMGRTDTDITTDSIGWYLGKEFCGCK